VIKERGRSFWEILGMFFAAVIVLGIVGFLLIWVWSAGVMP
jgi:hypothetical protein